MTKGSFCRRLVGKKSDPCLWYRSLQGVAEPRRSATRLQEAVVADPLQWWDKGSYETRLESPESVCTTRRHVFWVEQAVRPAKPAGWYHESQEPGLGSVDRESSGWLTMHEETLEAGSWRKLCEDGQLSKACNVLHPLVQRGTLLSKSIFQTLLKACAAKKDLAAGRCAHALISRSGYDSDTTLADHMIRMYSANGCLSEAGQLFSKLGVRNTSVWGSIISAYAEHGQPRQALTLYAQLQESDLKADNYVFVAALKACARAADLASGRQVHAHIRESLVKPNVFVGNALVDMYSKCGSLLEARTVFDSLVERDVVTWNAMIAGYAQNGQGKESLSLYSSMQKDNMALPTCITFVCLLKACGSIGALHEGKQLHREIREKGLEAHVGSSLVDMYAKCGSLEEARRVFDRLPTKDVVTWNAMIGGYAQRGLAGEALDLYLSMLRYRIAPASKVTYLCLMKACSSIGAIRIGKLIHSEIRERGLETEVVVGNSLIDMYAKCGSLGDARQVFDSLGTRDKVSWTALIAGYAQHGLGQEALDLYASMVNDGVGPPDARTFVCLLKACGSVGAISTGKHIHTEILERGLEAQTFLGNTLVDMYVRCGRVEDARLVFERLPNRDVVSWNALLNGYSQHSDGQMAMQCFQDMQQEGVEPNEATFIGLLKACSHEGMVDEGRQYFTLMVDEHGITPTADHTSCMVDLLGRAGHLDEAERMLRGQPLGGDAVGWRSLLSCCKTHDDTVRGRRCFDRLVSLEPDEAAPYVLMSGIYANAGSWADVDRIETMRRSAGAHKKPARTWIEVNSKVHEFVVGGERADVSSKLRSLNVRLDKEGHAPHTELVLKPVSDKEKEDALCGHAEKLALAYGLLNTPEGTTLLVTKNLRMCNDCHSGTKMLSSIEKREIIVRDAHRVHHFSNGFCSCGDSH